jgi:hypothetical protein
VTFIGKVSNGAIVLPPGAHLPDGTAVEVRPIETTGDDAALAGAVADLTDELVRLSKQTRELPADLAAQHDHYLHGHPKR